MNKILLFAGTSEGRKLFELLKENKISCITSVATEYGSDLLKGNKLCKVIKGRMNAQEMSSVIKKEGIICVVDATHPFAKEVSVQIKKACKETSVKYIRLKRNTYCGLSYDKAFYFDSIEKISEYLTGKKGNIFVTTGSKELKLLTKKIKNKERVFARILPSFESLLLCKDAGIPSKNIIAMQGPFSEELNKIMFLQTEAKYVVLKESGSTGGFAEKVSAAQMCGAQVLILKNSESNVLKKMQTENNFFQTVEKINKVCNTQIKIPKQKIILIGIGPGSKDMLSLKAYQEICDADVVFGAETVLKNDFLKFKNSVPFYRFADVKKYLKVHGEYEKPVVVFSGDCGFYSGASLFVQECKDFFDCELLPGISSLNYFSAKLKEPWHDWTILSMHGKECDLEKNIKQNKKCFVLLSGREDLETAIKKLQDSFFQKRIPLINIKIGFNLSREDEKLISFDIRKKVDVKKICSKQGLYSILVEHLQKDVALDFPLVSGLDDSCFLRTKIPMTKKDVRTLILNRMNLKENSVVYDIGCGTGSVTVESALLCKKGHVYSFDMKTQAVELTKKNVEKFNLFNVQVVKGEAPDCMEPFPKPDSVFIGGSSGNIKSIIRCVVKKNKDVRIVAAFITIEGLCALTQMFSYAELKELEVTQVAITSSCKVGSFHLMKANNPVWIVSFSGRG